MEIIVTEATNLFLVTGFAATKMDDVAMACRISKRTLYRLFPSKIDLFRAMVERHRHSMITFPACAENLPLEEALLQVFRIDLDPITDSRRVAFLQSVLAESKTNPELGEILRCDGREPAKLLLAEWLGRRKLQGAANIGDPHSAASILMDMVFGAVALKPIEVSCWPGGADRQTYLIDCIRYFVNGVK